LSFDLNNSVPWITRNLFQALEPIATAPWARIAFQTDGAAAGDIINEKPLSEMIFPTPIVIGCLSTYKLQNKYT
jgi:hypothetical protein